MKSRKAATKTARLWQKTQFSNLIRYTPSGTYFARLRVNGKLIRKTLKTDVLSVAKLRLADFAKVERQGAESGTNVSRGKLTFGEALDLYRQRINGAVTLKQRSKDYYAERTTALRNSWPDLEKTDIRKITKADCMNWAASFGHGASPTAYNNTVKVLRDVLAIGMESGARYDNPALCIKRASPKAKKLKLPEFDKFNDFVATMEVAGGRFSRSCADLVRFLAYGGFRKSEAANIQWQDCDFVGKKIAVWGDPENRTKNGEFRSVPMIPDMVQLLDRSKAERLDAKPDDSVMLVHECQKAMDRAAKIVGMPRITHHDLRHLFATRCIESGVDIPTVSRWLGHKDGGALAMKVYGHLRDQHSVEMAQKVRFSKPHEAQNGSNTPAANTTSNSDTS
ncbi:MAG: tyrosine-type recombinase/integrase [Limisphaerales bacterium]